MGYVRGGYRTILAALRTALEQKGATIRLGTKAVRARAVENACELTLEGGGDAQRGGRAVRYDIGRPATVRGGLGVLEVSGRSRVPSPPAMITAFTTGPPPPPTTRTPTTPARPDRGPSSGASQGCR